MLLAAGQLLACSGDKHQSALVSTRSRLEGIRFDGRASRWVRQRGNVDNLVQCTDERAGERLCVGRGGEILRDGPKKAEWLGQWANEPLTDVWREGTAVRLLGESGSVYVLDEQHSRIARALVAKERFRKTVRVAHRLLALDSAGRLQYSEDAGASWHASSRDVPRGFALAADAAGRVVLLSAPEQLHVSTDGGRSFKALAHQSEGVTALGNDAAGQIRAFSLLHEPSRVLPESANLAAQSSPKPLRFPLAEYFTAEDFLERRVAELDEDSVVLRRRERGWVGYRGRIGEPLDGAWPVAGLDCVNLQLIAVKNRLIAVCSKSIGADRVSPLSLLESRDSGRHFEPIDANVSGAIAFVLGLGLAGTDTFLLSGVCVDVSPPGESAATLKRLARSISGCRGNSAYRVSVESPGEGALARRARFEQLRLAPLLKPPTALAASPTGAQLALVATRAKNETLTLFRSTDRGKSFAVQPLHLERKGDETRAAIEQGGRFTVPNRLNTRRRVEHLALADDGTATLVTKQLDHPMLVTLEPDGTERAVADAPSGVSQLGASSEGALAVSISESRVFETTNLGAEFLAIASGKGKICHSADCAVVCRGSACLVGSHLSRVGFGEGPELIAPFELPDSEPDPSKPSAGGYDCRIAGAGWQSLKGTGAMPDALAAGFSEWAFYWLGQRPRDTQLVLAKARRGANALFVSTVFAPSRPNQASATALLRSPSGWAAARVQNVLGPSDPFGFVDFRWENLTLGDRHQKRVRFSEPVGASVLPSRTLGLTFSPAAMAPVGSKLLVELGGYRPGGFEHAYLLSEVEREQLLKFPRWPVPKTTAAYYAREADQVVRVAFDESGAVLLLGRDGDELAQLITVMAPSDVRPDRRPTFGYLGLHSGVVIPENVPEFLAFPQSKAASRALPLEPLSLNAPAELVACDQAARSSGQRFLLSSEAMGGPARVLLTLGETSVVPLRTGRWVLYDLGTKACWEAVEAFDEAHEYSALLFGESLAASWVFHSAKDGEGAPELLWSRLGCQREPSLNH